MSTIKGMADQIKEQTFFSKESLAKYEREFGNMASTNETFLKCLGTSLKHYETELEFNRPGDIMLGYKFDQMLKQSKELLKQEMEY